MDKLLETFKDIDKKCISPSDIHIKNLTLLLVRLESPSPNVHITLSQCHIIFSALRYFLQIWNSPPQKEKGGNLALFILDLSKLFSLTIFHLNEEVTEELEKFFKLFSYPLAQCFKMAEVYLTLITFLPFSQYIMLCSIFRGNLYSYS